MQVKCIVEGEHSSILSSFFNVQFVIKAYVLSIFEWPFYTDFTVSQLNNGNGCNYTSFSKAYIIHVIHIVSCCIC